MIRKRETMTRKQQPEANETYQHDKRPISSWDIIIFPIIKSIDGGVWRDQIEVIKPFVAPLVKKHNTGQRVAIDQDL